jgi:uncharacterized membrane protein
MSVYLTCYAVAFVLFAALDIVWLMLMGSALFKPVLGDMLAPAVRLGPALAFYLMYPIGLVILAIGPALRSGSPTEAILLGVVVGAVTYATYDLTNYATLRNWSLKLTVVDILYGSIVASGVAGLTYLIAPPMAAWMFGTKV